MKNLHYFGFCNFKKVQVSKKIFNLIGIALIACSASAFCSDSPTQIPSSASPSSATEEATAVTRSFECADPSTSNHQLLSGLSWCDLDRVKDAVAKGANVEALDSLFFFLDRSHKRLDTLPIVQYLIEDCHVDACCIDKAGRSVLHYAVQFAWDINMPVIQYLIDHGAPINHPDGRGETPLMLVKKMMKGADNLISFLIANGAIEGHSVVFQETSEQKSKKLRIEQERNQSIQIREAHIRGWLDGKGIKELDEDMQKKISYLAHDFHRYFSQSNLNVPLKGLIINYREEYFPLITYALEHGRTLNRYSYDTLIGIASRQASKQDAAPSTVTANEHIISYLQKMKEEVGFKLDSMHL